MPSEDSAAERARWLAELAEALDQARLLTKQLGAAEEIEAVELYAQIETLRLEVEMLRLRRSVDPHKIPHPKWTNGIPWRLSA